MLRHPLRAIALVLVVLATAACGAGAPSSSPSAAPVTYEESNAALCAAFGSMLRAVGNPDTGTPSVLSKQLDDAVAAGNIAAAALAAAGMKTELETGRQQAAVAARWPPAAASMAAMDRLLLAFTAMIAAKQAVAAHTPGADPQAAFEKADGVDAWTAMLTGISTMPVPSGVTPVPCKAFSGTP